MNGLTDNFSSLWDSFITSFKGILLSESKNQTISLEVAQAALNEASSSWFSEYTINGRWLYKLRQDCPARGELIKEIIAKDMVLAPIESNSSPNPGLKYIASIGTGVVGYGISQLAHFSTLGTLCTTLIPMAAAYPITESMLNSKKERASLLLINAYVMQLSKYRESIISALIS